MTVIRAMALRPDLRGRRQRQEQDVANLTTAPLRDAGQIPVDALLIAPPRKHWTVLPRAVPGRLVDGTVPDDHLARFVLRMPDEWNGGLVVAASSGFADANTYDLYFSDYLLLRGYAFAVTDKAIRSAMVDGDTLLMPYTSEGHMSHWLGRIEDLARLAIAEVTAYYGRAPSRRIAAGISNGGYIARRAAESTAGLFDGALEVSGVLWRADKGNLLRELPEALRATRKRPWDEAALVHAGMPGYESDWEKVATHYRVYWDMVMHLFLGYLDPEYTGPVEDYDLDSRPARVLETIRTFENSGNLQIPLVSLTAERDFLITCASHAVAYCDLVKKQGKGSFQEFIIAPDSCHIDSELSIFTFASPLMLRAHDAFEKLEQILGAARKQATTSK